MSTKKQSRLHRIAAVLNGIIFMLGGALFIEDDKLLFAGVLFLAGLANLMGMRSFREQRHQNRVANLIQIFNILVAAMTAWDYFHVGKKYIQYVWILVAAVSLTVLLVQNRKSRLS